MLAVSIPIRYRRLTDDRVLELRSPRLLFFLLGPFYLLWLRLWQEAVAFGVGAWLLVHASMELARSAIGSSRPLEPRAAFAAFDSIRAGAARGVPSDQAFQDLMAMLLPYYAAGALLALMGTHSAVPPVT
jgi:hypothetical protein